jgi:cyclase
LLTGPVKPGLCVIRLPNPGPSVVARVTDEGVDNTFDFHYEPILSLVKSVTSQPVKYVINTHHHSDHTGGNVQLL